MQYASDTLLAVACAACAWLIGQARGRYAEADQPALFCALLGFLLSAAAAFAGLSQDWQAAHLWLSQASRFLGLPLLGAAALALGRGWAWSRPNWGRIVLGLCAFFELFRQMGYLEDYQLALNLASLALIIYAGAVQWPRRMPLAAASTVAGLLLLVIIEPLWRLELSNGLLIAAYPLLAWLLLKLPGTTGKTAG